ncbi:LLM class flavin-dependent oxidoreductase [Micromonospora sp. NPDC048830]|uniref:LLM class flavin-dependent oxidoreductase n=1 Tax=Micromonospora sp. NPDC048830 TaxID=3364257 RepID=UPI0037173DA7
MSELRLGIAVPQSYTEPQATVTALSAFVRQAESFGFDSLWVQEQILGRDTSFEPMVNLAYVAALTSRIRLCAGAFIAPVRNPVVFAKQLASIDQLSGGRLTVGLGLGDMAALYDASGVPLSRRVRRLEQVVDVCRALWTQSSVTYSGVDCVLDGAAMEPKPVQKPHPPLWFAARSNAALQRTVRIGSGWISAGGASEAEFRELVKVLVGLLPPGGRESFTVAKKVYMAVEPTREQAFVRLRAWFRAHWAGLADPDELTERVGLYGTADDCAEQLARIRDAGADLIVLNPVYDEPRQLDLIAAELVPRLDVSMVNGGRSDE